MATQNGLPYSGLALQHWSSYEAHKSHTHHGSLDGTQLSLGQILAVARHGAQFEINEVKLESLDAGYESLQKSVASGAVIYGVSTGFGGSANTRTTKITDLQKTLLREFNSGVLPLPDVHDKDGQKPVTKHRAGLLIQDLAAVNCMPVAWTRASMLIRLNSLISGCSGVRRTVVESVANLVKADIVPDVPVFGSISASGDLAPSSYIGSAIQGKANISCTVGAIQGNPQTMSAKLALANAGLHAEQVGPKEALAIMNGTAFSCGVSALVMHDAHALAVLSQVLTAMSVEALKGSDESFDSFFGRVRPHTGQINAAKSIKGFLAGSKLINDHGGEGIATLRQDRYSIRTASQWLSPVLEDLQLAHTQVSVECNSVTDNPLIDTSSGAASPRFLHGGNFQARSLTSAMEKVRQSMQTIGRMLFAQCTEIINPATNQGLPPNLVADEPSESFIFKSIDIMIAALQSELGFLANPVGNHVQTAEMGNQALNSLALISGRYTLNAIDVLSKLTAAHLLVACQALDLRVMTLIFYQSAKAIMRDLAHDWYDRLNATRDGSKPAAGTTNPGKADRLADVLYANFCTFFEETAVMDSTQRFELVTTRLQQFLVAQVQDLPTSTRSQPLATDLCKALQAWSAHAAEVLRTTYLKTRDDYLADPQPAPYLGKASRKMHAYVRRDLRVPFLNTAVLTQASEKADQATEDTPTIGTFMTRIYTAIRDGSLYAPAMEVLEEVHVPNKARL